MTLLLFQYILSPKRGCRSQGVLLRAETDEALFRRVWPRPMVVHAKINSLTDMPAPLGSSGGAEAAAADTRAPLAFLNDFVFTREGAKNHSDHGTLFFLSFWALYTVALHTAVINGARNTAVPVRVGC